VLYLVVDLAVDQRALLLGRAPARTRSDHFDRDRSRTVRPVKPAGDERTPDGTEYTASGQASEDLLTIAYTEDERALVLAVDGEVDILTAPRLQAAISAAFDRLAGRVMVVDLTTLGFLGSPGLRTLLETASKAARQPGYQTLRVVVDHNRPVIRPIEIAGLDHVLALYHSVGEALS
jgi:anti-sigma B factor antagonist